MLDVVLGALAAFAVGVIGYLARMYYNYIRRYFSLVRQPQALSPAQVRRIYSEHTAEHARLAGLSDGDDDGPDDDHQYHLDANNYYRGYRNGYDQAQREHAAECEFDNKYAAAAPEYSDALDLYTDKRTLNNPPYYTAVRDTNAYDFWLG